MNQGLRKPISRWEADGARVPDLIKVSKILPETKSMEAIKVIKKTPGSFKTNSPAS